ncbi:MAG: 16S rRNA (cytidine(1402)-2'-O)-methyltransferase [Flavobacteriaceae bacterium]|nr:16S rRNA (cytidine(1402)-2'-O)-methyltransferase [Flavobacteriaceae bacterium]
MTLRGIRLMKEVDLILAEDTRTSQKLLNHYEIKTSMQSFHMHNEHKKVAQVIQEVLRGKTIALISDAGTPGISDPGYLLVHEALKQGVKVECLPGPTALIPALVQSGLPSDRFVFEGFLPPKKGRQGRLKQMAEEIRTTVFYESPHKIIKTLGQMLPYFGPERKLAVVRELSKKFESNFRGSLEEAVHFFEEHSPKGEFVIVVEGTKNK